jgi:hypothetical protein
MLTATTVTRSAVAGSLEETTPKPNAHIGGTHVTGLNNSKTAGSSGFVIAIV